ncbi:MAG: DUF4434 domain-containing protein [Micromonosporaceae bacterium]|nr:DUF4434 domain-containing protein [Micromonosporaceae bacterium]
MDRRFVVVAAIASLALALLPAPDSANATPNCTASPRLSGSFIQPDLVDSWTNTQIANEDTKLKNACITTQILQWTADSKNHTATYDTGLTGYTWNTSTDVPDRLLSHAESAGIDAYVGLQINDDWWTKYADDTTWLSKEATFSEQLADEVYANYGPYDSFAGWYLPFEVDNDHFQTTTEQDNLARFYATVIGYLHSTFGRPVVISPFFNANLGGALDPSGWQTMWTRILDDLGSTAPDVIALQDGVGAGHATSAQLGAWFSATRSAISTAGVSTSLYDDAETYQLGPSGFQPMPIGPVVTDMSAVSASVAGYWSFSYDHYQSPLSTFANSAYHNSYLNYLANGTVESTAPTTPGPPSANAVDSQTVSLSWTASTDAVGVAGYDIYRNGQLVAATNGTGTGFTDTQLDASTSYTYTVKAFDGAGNTSSASSSASATTPAGPSYGTNWSLGKTYTASVAADASYPDTGGTELTDGVLAATPTYVAAWQGRNSVGTYSFTIDLGASHAIKSLNSTWLQVRSDFVFLPNSVTYAVSTDGTSYTTVGTINRPAIDSSDQIKTYRLIGLNVTGRYVRITVDGGTAWSMVDEAQALTT